MTEGGGTRRPLESPVRTASSQSTATPTGEPTFDVTAKNSVSLAERCATAQSCTPLSIFCSAGDFACTLSARSRNWSPAHAVSSAPAMTITATGSHALCLSTSSLMRALRATT